MSVYVCVCIWVGWKIKEPWSRAALTVQLRVRMLMNKGDQIKNNTHAVRARELSL